MGTLNLIATTTPQQRVKEYLEQNVSEVLADKINNGVQIEKDGGIFISKKTLDGFMAYANEEARKQAEKGARCACIEDSVVFGWAIHYFEEDNIEGTLYNEDGTEYVAPKPSPKKSKKVDKAETTVTPKQTEVTSSPEVTPVANRKKPSQKTTKQEDGTQMSIFDFMLE